MVGCCYTRLEAGCYFLLPATQARYVRSTPADNSPRLPAGGSRVGSQISARSVRQICRPFVDAIGSFVENRVRCLARDATTACMYRLIFILLLASTLSADLVKTKARVMSADYRGDLAELARLRDELQDDKTYLGRYWSGFASWRIAINGANQGMKPDELMKNLRLAATDFYASARAKEDFADAYSAASLVNGWLATFSFDDPIAMRERIGMAQVLFARASALEPKNPRVLWTQAAFYLYTPKEQGGSVPRAIELYEQMRDEAGRRGTNAASPLPDWGKAEALMSLGFAHMMQSELGKAREAAQAALQAQPEWSYVKDTLIPQIEAKQKQ